MKRHKNNKLAKYTALVAPGTKVVGHRGLPTSAPENTLSALRAAAAHGLVWVEFDVQLTHDEVPVIMHDDKVDRTTNGVGRVCTYDLQQLKKFDCGLWFDKANMLSKSTHLFVGERVPTLKEFCEECKRLSLAMNVELKSDGTYEEQLAVAKRVTEVLRKCGCVPATKNLKKSYPELHNGARVLLSSFSETALGAVGSEFPRALLLDSDDERKLLQNKHRGDTVAYLNDVIARLDQLGCAAVHCGDKQPLLKKIENTSEKILFADAMHEAGYAVHVYTVNNVKEANFLVNGCRVDAVFSDFALDVKAPQNKI